MVGAVPADPTEPVALRFDGARLHLLDQTLLPGRERWLDLGGPAEVAAAIRRLAVRGAPLIGIAAAYGLALGVAADPEDAAVEAAWRELREARPTAVNLARAADRIRAAALAVPPSGRAAAARAEAERLHADEDAAALALSRHGADLLAPARRVLTHCNAGALAAGGEGTALGVIRELARRGPVEVLACETRPLLQGARLTVWELARAGLPHALVADPAAAGLIARCEVDAVVVGCDRVAANGDVANKVGTYGLALAARAAGIPFVVAGPCSTVDAGTPDGAAIAIEERNPDEVRHAGGTLITLPGTACRNPAFDVTPAELVTALVTERGVARPVGPGQLAALAA
jgi:methylthioribose-1-phosphate isomerase